MIDNLDFAVYSQHLLARFLVPHDVATELSINQSNVTADELILLLVNAHPILNEQSRTSLAPSLHASDLA